MAHKKASVSVSEFNKHVNSWCELRLKMNHQPSSVAAGRKDLAVFKEFCKQKKIRRINGNTLINFVIYLHDIRKNGSGSINRKRSTLRCYFKHLKLKTVHNADKVPVNSLSRAREPYSGPVQVLDSHEVLALLSSIDRSTVLGIRNFTLFSLLYALGLRISEALGICMHDIDWKKEMILIRGKGRKQRSIPLTTKVQRLLKEWIEYRSAIRRADSQPHLFLSKRGKQLSVRRAEEIFKDIVTSAGQLSLGKVTPHSFRHAFASHAVDGNADLLVLKTILGHACLKTTEIYLHPSLETLKKAVNNHLANDIIRDLHSRRVGRYRIQKHNCRTG